MKTNTAIRSFLLQKKTNCHKQKLSKFLEENKPINREQRRMLEKGQRRGRK